MFERFENAKRERGGWRTVALAVSVMAHVVGGMAVVVWSFWHIERLQTKSSELVFSAPLPPPPALGAPEAPPAPKTVHKPKAVKPTEVVQPTNRPEPPKPTEEPEGPDTAATPGDPTGVPGGDPNAPPTTTPGTGTGTPESEPPIIDDRKVDISVLESLRVSGNRQISLPPSVLQKLHDARQSKAEAVVLLCLDATGVPKKMTFARSTGFAEADEKIRREMSAWRYRPMVVGGRAVNACSPVRFVYVIE